MTDEPAISLAEAYEGISTVLAALAEPDRHRGTRCAGWQVDALVAHLLLDAQRALVALATPVEREPDTDAVSYWRRFNPGVEPGERNAHAGFATRLGAAYPTLTSLTTQWAHTSGAAVRAADQARPEDAVQTQGHVLSVADLCRTLSVEAVVHHLDLVADLPDAPTPASAPLAVAVATLDGLWGRSAPAEWDGHAYVLKATGREPLTDADRGLLGESAQRLPLLG